jgi:hypothetical protein
MTFCDAQRRPGWACAFGPLRRPRPAEATSPSADPGNRGYHTLVGWYAIGHYELDSDDSI